LARRRRAGVSEKHHAFGRRRNPARLAGRAHPARRWRRSLRGEQRPGQTARLDAENARGRFVKHVHNAFTDTGLDRWLRTRGIRKLIVTGIRTEQCCETTTRVASDLGYEVDFVGDATLTFPMTDPRSGRQFSAAEIRERTELVLRDRFARIATVEEALGNE
jgi:isochorismate hydrolase